MSSKTVYEELVPQFILDSEIVPPCAEADPDSFFAKDDYDGIYSSLRTSLVYENERAAKAICFNCPMRADCLTFAVKTGQQGIWGGTNENERRAIRRKFR